MVSSQTEIDNITTNKEAAQFLTAHINKKWTYAHVFHRKETPNGFKKVDLDRNGTLDLIIESQNEPYHCMVLDLGNHVYKKLVFEEKQDFWNTAELRDVILHKNEQLLIYKTPIYSSDLAYIPDQSAIMQEQHPTIDSILHHKIDTLVVKRHSLLKYNSKKIKPLQLDRIELVLEKCYWYCPNYILELKKDTKATYTNTMEQVTESYSLNINPYTFKELAFLVSYLELEQVSKTPSILINDGQAISLTIYYDNGKKLCFKNHSGQIKQQVFYPIYEKLVAVRNAIFKANGKAIPKKPHAIYMDRDSF
jgi:hypothetical protein